MDDPVSPAPPRDAPAPGATPKRSWSARLKRVAAWSGLLATGACAAAAVYVCVLIFTTPDVAELRRAQNQRPSVILSADGEVIGRFSSQYHAPVTLKEVSPEVVKALIATEDHRFYQHSGIDPKRIVASAWNTLRGNTQGASTLTQQLARNLFPQEIGNERSLNRKLREAITALRLERTSTKEQILESYLNTAPFLYNVRGIEMAARTYFDKPAAKLDTAQSATLVGMLKGSQRYNPVRNPERAHERRNLVLAQMVRHGTLAPARYAQLRAQPLALAFKRPEDGGIGQARHFVAHVREQLVDWADANDVNFDSDGLVIRTTLDAKLQKLAQDALVQQVAVLQRIAGEEWSEARLRTAQLKPAPLAKGKPAPATAPFAHFWRENAALRDELARDTPQYRSALQASGNETQALATVLGDAETMRRLLDDKTRLSAGFIAIEPGTGAVRAWVGSPDFGREQFDHVSQARRQPGSTFKPFVYGAALQRGLSTERVYVDEPVDIRLPNGSIWQPSDAGGPSHAPMTMRDGLVHSKNTITAQVMQDVGAEAVINFAHAAGVRASKLDPVPSLALGTSSVSLLEMGNAYATLAALGERREPLFVTHITDRNGRVLQTFDAKPERVLERSLVERLVDVMRGVVQIGTGAAIRSEFGVRGDLAGKTGTTQNNTDGWFMLMSPKLVAGAWVGFNDQRVTIRSNYWGQGGHNALRIVGTFMQQGQKAKLIDSKAAFPQVTPDAAEPQVPAPGPEVAPNQGPLDALARLLGFRSAPAAPVAAAGPANANAPLPSPIGRPAPAPADAAAERAQRDQALGR